MSENDQRHFRRLSLKLPAILRWRGHQCDVKIADISLKGVMIQLTDQPNQCPDYSVLSEEILRSGRPQVELTLLSDPERIELLKLELELVHQNDGSFGGEWVNIDVDSLAHLRNVLDYNLGDDSLIERELSELWQ